MREGAQPLKVAQPPSSSTSSSLKTKDGATTAAHNKGKKNPQTSRKVKFTTPPKYKTKRSLKNMSNRSGKPRTALKTLQPHATNTKILVGTGSPRIASIGKSKKGLKQTQLPLSPPLPESVITVTEECEEVWESHPKPKSDGTQRVCDDVKIDSTSSIDYKMITEETPPTEYWQVLAEQRREALAETLKENEELYAEIDRLKARVEELENQVQDKNYFAMMYKIVSGRNDPS